MRNKIYKKTRTFLRLRKRHKALFIMAFLCSAFARFCTRYISMKYWIRWFSTTMHGTSGQVPNIPEIRYIIRLVKKASPWKTNCLVDALTARMILKALNCNSLLYLGLKQDNGRIKAHAWLKDINEKAILGLNPDDRYRTVYCIR